MIAGPIDIQWIKWGDRAMTLRGVTEYLAEPATFTIAYAHVSTMGLVNDSTLMGGGRFMRLCAGGQVFDMTFQDVNNARDCAAELARRMEMAR